MPRSATAPSAVLLALTFLAPLLLGSSTDGGHSGASADVLRAVEDTQAMTWAPSNYWAFRVLFDGAGTRDIALVVHEAREDGFRLGSNLSAGFFGLPFNGNMTRDLNPEVAGDVWPMFQFPLNDGQQWDYRVLGYDATTTARAALVTAPGVGEHPGFRLEAVAYGQVFARYDYSPLVGWLTRLTIIEPTTGEPVVDAHLTGYGPRYGAAYFVEEVVGRLSTEYPRDAPGEIALDLPSGYARLRATLVAEARAGLVDARIVDAHGRVLAAARAAPQGAVADEATTSGDAARWRLEHAGAGLGEVRVEVTGLVPVGTNTPPPADAIRIDLRALMPAAPADQSTLPALPQTGHVTSTGWPVAV